MTAAGYVMGIDLGTTTCRCAIFDFTGGEIAAAYCEIPVRYPRPLWAEVDPDDWWRCTRSVVGEALAQSGLAAAQIAAVGLTGLMHAPVLLDGHGDGVAPAMLWMDQRCTDQAERLRREAERLGLKPGASFSTNQSAAKLRWIAEQRPDLLARATMLMLPKDFVRYRLTGVAGTDPSDAGGTGLFDRTTGSWNWDAARLTGVPRALLPAIRPSTELAGYITGEAATATGLHQGTPVAMGGSDTLCTRMGMAVGVEKRDEIALYLGTAAWIALVATDAEGAAPTLRGFGATSTTGAALRWTRSILSTPGEPMAAGYDWLTATAAGAPPGSDGLTFLPHLMGERGPTADPLARGAFAGLTLYHGRAHIVRAVLEGTAFQLRRLIDARVAQCWPGRTELPGGVASGGAARSPFWMQLLADMTHVTLRVPAIVEAATLGAAMLGGAAAGLFDVETAPARMVRPGVLYTPDDATAARYDRCYRRYCRLDDLLAPWFHEHGDEDAAD